MLSVASASAEDVNESKLSKERQDIQEKGENNVAGGVKGRRAGVRWTCASLAQERKGLLSLLPLSLHPFASSL